MGVANRQARRRFSAGRTTPGIVLLVLAAVVAGGWVYRTTASARRAVEAVQPNAVDIGFAQSMSLHHQQAIGMAQRMLEGGPTPLATLARSIAYSQLLELGQMQGWLRLWSQSLAPPARSMDWMLAADEPPDAALLQYLLDCQNAPSGMSGLATDAELEQLRQLDGRAKDALFLSLMLKHHEGGLPMARFAARHAHLPVVRALASQVVLDQSEEIRRMRMTLNALAASPTP
jgi:uncharacterized protein (DUF305 family)